MPVLSEHITVVLPRVSADGSLLIRAFRRAIAVTPKAKVMVNIAGSPSGIAATARDTEAIKESTKSYPHAIANIKLKAANARIAMTMTLVKSSIFLINGTVISLVSFMNSAILPSSVCSPVATTTPCPEPRVMKVPPNAIPRWSAGVKSGFRMGSVFFSTGTDSPVSAASSALRFFA